MTWPERRTLVIAGVIAVVVSLAAVGGWFWYEAQQRRVAAAYAEAMARVVAARTPQATPEARAAAAAGLEGVIARHPSAPTVSQAAYELGNLKFEAKQYAAARSAYEIALARGSSATVRTLARVGLGYTWEAERDYAKAIDAYQTVLKGLGPRDFMYEEGLMSLARAQELAGQKTEAADTYRKLLKDVPATRRAEDVKTRLAALAGGTR